MILYYLPEVTPNEIDAKGLWIAEHGLSYAFDAGCAVTRAGIAANGPDGGKGVAVCRDGGAAGYYPDLQDWEQSTVNPLVWIGYPKKVDPLSLIRDQWRGDPLAIESGTLTTRVGTRWPIPIALGWSVQADKVAYRINLPRSLKFDGSEFVNGDVLPQFEKLESFGMQIMDMYLANEMVDDFVEFASRVFSLVYYAGPEEFARLGVVVAEAKSVWNLLWIVMDGPAMESRMQKKTQ